MITFDKKENDSWEWLKKYEIPSLSYIFAIITSRFHTGWTLQTLKEEPLFETFDLFNLAIDIAKKEKKEIDEAKGKNSSNKVQVNDSYEETINYEELRKEDRY